VEGEFFSIDFADQITLQLRQAHIFNVTFAPTRTGNFAGRLLINSNDPDNQQVIVNLSGVCTPGIPPTIALDEWGHYFDVVPVNSEPNLDADERNQGDLDLNIRSVETTAAEFTTSFMAPVTIPAEGVFGVQVTFTPLHSQYYESELIIRSNDPQQDVIGTWVKRLRPWRGYHHPARSSRFWAGCDRGDRDDPAIHLK